MSLSSYIYWQLRSIQGMLSTGTRVPRPLFQRHNSEMAAYARSVRIPNPNTLSVAIDDILRSEGNTVLPIRHERVCRINDRLLELFRRNRGGENICSFVSVCVYQSRCWGLKLTPIS